jgi:hypothetical protein
MNSYPSYCCGTRFRPRMHKLYTWRWYGLEFTETHHVGQPALILIFYYRSMDIYYLRKLLRQHNLRTPRTCSSWSNVLPHVSHISTLSFTNICFTADISWRTWITTAGNIVIRNSQYDKFSKFITRCRIHRLCRSHPVVASAKCDEDLSTCPYPCFLSWIPSRMLCSKLPPRKHIPCDESLYWIFNFQ